MVCKMENLLTVIALDRLLLTNTLVKMGIHLIVRIKC
jgi:hypothetical protein